MYLVNFSVETNKSDPYFSPSLFDWLSHFENCFPFVASLVFVDHFVACDLSVMPLLVLG